MLFIYSTKLVSNSLNIVNIPKLYKGTYLSINLQCLFHNDCLLGITYFNQAVTVVKLEILGKNTRKINQ